MSGLRPRTLLWQLGLALMVMQAVVALVFGAWGYSLLKRFHYEQTTGQLQQGVMNLWRRRQAGSSENNA